MEKFKIEMTRNHLIGFSKETFYEFHENLCSCVESAKDKCDFERNDFFKIFEVAEKFDGIDQNGFEITFEDSTLVFDSRKRFWD